jgi:ribosomal protein L12E/L44/L45/RPP1/RPP2
LFGELAVENGDVNSFGEQDDYKHFASMVNAAMSMLAAYDTSELRKTLENPVVVRLIEEGGISDYTVALASAALTLGFVGKDINSQAVERLLLAADLEMNKTVRLFLALINLLRRKNHHPYMFAYYTLVFLGKSPDLEEMLKIAPVLGADAPDANTADEVIDFSKKHEIDMSSETEAEYNGTEKAKPIYSGFRDMIVEVYSMMGDFSIRQMEGLLSKKYGTAGPKKELYPYIWAIATLPAAGRDIDRGNIGKLLAGAGVRVNDAMVNEIISIKFRNHLVYIVSLYYLRVVGKEQSLQQLLGIVKAFDILPDAKVAQESMDYYNMKKGIGKQ